MVLYFRKVAFKFYGPFTIALFFYVPCAMIMLHCSATALEIASRRRKRNIGESSARKIKMGTTNHFFEGSKLFERGSKSIIFVE